MSHKFADVLEPGHTAILTQECQGAVIGPNAGLAALAEEARREALPNIVRLVPGPGRPAFRSCTAWCSAAPTVSAPTTTPRSSP